MSAADLLIAIGQAGLSTIALLMLFDSTTYVDPRLSLAVATALILLSAGLFVLLAPVGAVLAAIGAAAWLGIFFFRGENSARKSG